MLDVIFHLLNSSKAQVLAKKSAWNFFKPERSNRIHHQDSDATRFIKIQVCMIDLSSVVGVQKQAKKWAERVQRWYGSYSQHLEEYPLEIANETVPSGNSRLADDD